MVKLFYGLVAFGTLAPYCVWSPICRPWRNGSHFGSTGECGVSEGIIKKFEYNKGRKWDWDKINETHT